MAKDQIGCHSENRGGLCIVVIHQGDIAPRLQRWLESVKPYVRDIVLHQGENNAHHANPIFEKCINCCQSRNEARMKALTVSSASRFWFLDSDVVPREDALDTLANCDLPVVAGWVQRKEPTVIRFELEPERAPLKLRPYVAGRWLIGDQVQLFYWPRTYRLMISHVVPVGCVVVNRMVAENFEFEPGIDRYCRAADFGYRMIVGESFAYGIRLNDAGFQCLMHPKIVCEHVDRAQINQPKKVNQLHDERTQPKEENQTLEIQS